MPDKLGWADGDRVKHLVAGDGVVVSRAVQCRNADHAVTVPGVGTVYLCHLLTLTAKPAVSGLGQCDPYVAAYEVSPGVSAENVVCSPLELEAPPAVPSLPPEMVPQITMSAERPTRAVVVEVVRAAGGEPEHRRVAEAWTFPSYHEAVVWVRERNVYLDNDERVATLEARAVAMGLAVPDAEGVVK